MTLADWQNNGWLRPHQTSSQEIDNLLAIVERDLQDVQAKSLSADWQFGIAYNAALKLCTILLYAAGYRPEKSLAHYRTITSMPIILGDEHSDDAAYLNACRNKRNIVEYDYAGGATDQDAGELISFTVEFKDVVIIWLKENHPDLLPE